MKRINIYFLLLFLLLGFFAIHSCTKDDNTTITTKQAFTQPVATSPEVRPDGTVLFSDSTVDLTWVSENKDGDAVKWNVYFGTGKAPALFQSNVSHNTISVPVIDGQTYYWKVEIADSRGITTTSEVNSFIAVSGLNPKISVDLSCTTDALTAVGLNLTPDQVVNLRLRVVNKSTMKVISTVNTGKSSETYSGLDTLADGEYLFAVDIFSTINAGDFNAPIKLAIALKFSQLGILDQTLEFPNDMTNEFACSSYRVYLSKVTKAGSNYTVEKSVKKPSTPFDGDWSGDEMDFFPDQDAVSVPFSSQVEIFKGCDLMIKNLGLSWMNDFWGEEVKSGGTAIIEIDTVAGTVNIADQYYMTTIYKGAVQTPYNLVGTGTIIWGVDSPSMTINYDLVQDGFSTAGYCNDEGFISTPTFVATIMLDKSAVKSIRKSASVRKFVLPSKK